MNAFLFMAISPNNSLTAHMSKDNDLMKNVFGFCELQTGTHNDIQEFTFQLEGKQIRVTEIDGSYWFVATDVCDILGIKNSRQALSYLDEDQTDCGITNDTMGRAREASIISESGLYELIFKSRMRAAKVFRRWVSNVVLPAIRQDGAYILGEEKVLTGEISEEELVARSVVIMNKKLIRLEEENAQLQNENIELFPMASKYHSFLDSKGGLDLTGTAKVLGTTAPLLAKHLRAIGWLWARKDRVLPMKKAVDKGYMRTVPVVRDGDFVSLQTVITPKGFDVLADSKGMKAAA